MMLKTIFLPAILAILVILSGCGQPTEASTTFAPWYPAANESGDPLFAVFEGRVPCNDCQVLKIGLALYRDQGTGTPTTYVMARVHVGSGNDRTIDTGTWILSAGTGLDPQAVVYRLDANAPREFRSFWAIGQDILFVLDQDMNPRVGTAAWSYVLNGKQE